MSLTTVGGFGSTKVGKVRLIADLYLVERDARRTFCSKWRLTFRSTPPASATPPSRGHLCCVVYSFRHHS
jgi:hypothetical protein